MAPENIFANIPQTLPEEVFQTLCSSTQVRIERIISQGHRSEPEFWYDQTQHEWILLLRGQAQLQFPDQIWDLQVGDYLHIPAHQKHRVAWTTPEEETIWLAVFYSD
jgi:cupin 2 domain-containing protein